MIMSSANSKLSNSLEAGISNSSDPETVKTALPAYIVMLDDLIEEDPENPNLLLSGAKLNSLYASHFVGDPIRRRTLSRKALAYAKEAVLSE